MQISIWVTVLHSPTPVEFSRYLTARQTPPYWNASHLTDTQMGHQNVPLTDLRNQQIIDRIANTQSNKFLMLNVQLNMNITIVTFLYGHQSERNDVGVGKSGG